MNGLDNCELTMTVVHIFCRRLRGTNSWRCHRDTKLLGCRSEVGKDFGDVPSTLVACGVHCTAKQQGLLFAGNGSKMLTLAIDEFLNYELTTKAVHVFWRRSCRCHRDTKRLGCRPKVRHDFGDVSSALTHAVFTA